MCEHCGDDRCGGQVDLGEVVQMMFDRLTRAEEHMTIDAESEGACTNQIVWSTDRGEGILLIASRSLEVLEQIEREQHTTALRRVNSRSGKDV